MNIAFFCEINFINLKFFVEVYNEYALQKQAKKNASEFAKKKKKKDLNFIKWSIVTALNCLALRFQK